MLTTCGLLGSDFPGLPLTPDHGASSVKQPILS